MKMASVLIPPALLVGLTLGLLAPARGAITGWSEQAVNTTTQGSTSVDANGVWTVQGSGNMPWCKRCSNDDSFEIVFKQLTGDGSVTTKLLGPATIGDHARIGIMMREDVTDPAAKMITLHRAGGGYGGDSFIRGVTGQPFSKDRKLSPVTDDPEGNANLFPSTQLPIWLKIERRGNDFTAYASADGAFWIPVGRTQHIPMNAAIAAGVFVAADSDGTLQNATFDGNATDVSGKLLTKPEEAAPLQPNPVIASGGDNQVSLSWNSVTHLGQVADGYRVYKGKVGDDNLTQLAELKGSETSYVDTTIKNGEIARYRVTTLVKLGDKVVESQPFSNQLYTFSGTPNPGPPIQIGGRVFQPSVLDCGGDHELTDKPGTASIDANGVVTLTFSGWDISMEADGGEALLTPVTGDFTFTARVSGVPTHPDGTDADEWAKSGIIMRETPLAESRYVGMFMTPQHGLRSAHRRMFNTGQTWDNGSSDTPDLPAYLRIQRRGTVLSVFTSTDGTTFTPNGDVETVDFADLPATVYIGFAGTAGGVQLPITQMKLDKVTLVQP